MCVAVASVETYYWFLYNDSIYKIFWKTSVPKQKHYKILEQLKSKMDQ